LRARSGEARCGEDAISGPLETGLRATTYNSAHFALTDAGDRVVFTAPVDGTTTKNSRYARSELREMNGAQEAAWSTTSGVHTLVVTQAVTRLPEAKGLADRPPARPAQASDPGIPVLEL
jgi:Alginate lyase